MENIGWKNFHRFTYFLLFCFCYYFKVGWERWCNRKEEKRNSATDNKTTESKWNRICNLKFKLEVMEAIQVTLECFDSLTPSVPKFDNFLNLIFNRIFEVEIKLKIIVF